MTLPGQKAQLINVTDQALADQQGISSIYRIEIHLTKSPEKGVLCGAISVFRNNSYDMDVNPFVDGSPSAQELAEKLKEEISTQTETRIREPIYFRETDGQWIEWALKRALDLYDEYGSADILVKAPKLKIREVRTSSSIAAGRSDLSRVFTTLKDIDQLLRNDFSWDPWTKTMRRGRIDAQMGKR